MSIIRKLAQRGALAAPDFVSTGLQYETVMGSESYGVATGSSDIDLYGFCIPNKDMIFPHLRGEIPGFGKQVDRFEQCQNHHIADPDGKKNEDGKPLEYDIQVFSVIKYANLLLDANPNILDSIFTPRRCVKHITRVGEHLRDNRRLFLQKGCYQRFRGYAMSQFHKMDIKQPQHGSKRAADVAEFGFDRKFAYHVVRLMLETEQILTTGDLNLERDAETLKTVRRGDWDLARIKSFVEEKDKTLEVAFRESKLPYRCDEDKVRTVLLECLEQHFGSLATALVTKPAAVRALDEIQEAIDRARLTMSAEEFIILSK